MPFIVLFIGFIAGFPVFVVGIASAIITILLSVLNFQEGEKNMLEGVGKIATPLVATIGFLFMSGVIKQIGLADLIGQIFTPMLTHAPIQSMLIVSALAGFVTQSNAASVAITIPFLQYYLTGGPVAALATVIPVIPGSELKAANKFQRPNMLFGLLVLFILSFIFSIF